MPRKNSAGTLDDQRVNIRARGRKRLVEKVAGETLSEFERNLKQEMLCYLVAAGMSRTYCADALGVARSTITGWLDDDELKLRERAAALNDNMLKAGVNMIQTYVLEIIEALMDIFRTTQDEAVAVKIGFEMLDRLGISKIQKVEANRRVTQTHEVEFSDKRGVISAVKNAPPEVQSAMAEMAERMVAIAQEHGEIPEPEQESVDA